MRLLRRMDQDEKASRETLSWISLVQSPGELWGTLGREGSSPPPDPTPGMLSGLTPSSHSDNCLA